MTSAPHENGAWEGGVSNKESTNTASVAIGDALLSAAFISGRRAGLQGLPSSSLGAQPGTPEYEEALRGWKSGTSELAYSDAMHCAC